MAIVRWTKGAPGGLHPEDAWWQSLTDAGWLSARGGCIVIHVARSARSTLVVETARSLIAYLRRTNDAMIDVIDPGGSATAWPGLGWIDLAATERLRIDAVCLRNGAMVPTLWLDDFLLVTVTGAAPDARYGLAGILAAQADLFPEAERDDLEAAYEAHRLLAADLDIACGTRRYGAPDSESWWAASDDDVSLERALAAAAGVAPATLPALQYLARHELMTAPNEISAGAVALERYVAPAGTVRAARTRTRLARLGRMIREDVGLASVNLHRIPQFIERRWPGLLPFGKGAA